MATFSAVKKWKLVRGDVNTAFLKTGESTRDVYVIPPFDSNDKRHYWLLFVAVCGLVNSNAKFQRQSYYPIYKLCLHHLSVIPQLFYLFKNGRLLLFVIKIVDDLLMTAEDDEVKKICIQFCKSF